MSALRPFGSAPRSYQPPCIVPKDHGVEARHGRHLAGRPYSFPVAILVDVDLDKLVACRDGSDASCALEHRARFFGKARTKVAVKSTRCGSVSGSRRSGQDGVKLGLR